MPREDTRMNAIVQELVRRTNDESRRLRSIEQRLEAAENKINTFEENSILRVKKISEKFAELEMAINAVNDDMIKFKNSLDKINKQMDKFALRREIKEIEKAFELLVPGEEIESISG